MTEGKIPEDRRYTKEHEWVLVGPGELTIGITDHAQSELTDIVFVDLPAVGKGTLPGQSVLVLESVKTVADIYAPVPGTVSAVNEELRKHPEWINQDPYGKGWIYRMKPAHEPTGLLDAAAYRAFVASGST